jgi:hypothetical protein
MHIKGQQNNSSTNHQQDKQQCQSNFWSKHDQNNRSNLGNLWSKQ